MNFYDIGFLKTQAGLTDYLWYIFIFWFTHTTYRCFFVIFEASNQDEISRS